MSTSNDATKSERRKYLKNKTNVDSPNNFTKQVASTKTLKQILKSFWQSIEISEEGFI